MSGALAHSDMHEEIQRLREKLVAEREKVGLAGEAGQMLVTRVQGLEKDLQAKSHENDALEVH